MTEQSASSSSKKLPWLTVTRLRGGALALGSMVFGTLVGMAVQQAVRTTGVLGPSVSALIEEQETNFGEVNKRLDELQGHASDPEVKRSLGELRELLRRQDELRQQAAQELRSLDESAATRKDAELAKSGYASAIDFWLKPGESVNVGGREQVFALVGAGRGLADVNVNGSRKRLVSGDQVQVKGTVKTCAVSLRTATPRQDGRIGFDLTCQ